MDNRAEVRDFLLTRRAKVTPDQAGVVSFGARRVAGLRRSEVAQLAAVSVEYYTRMERGNLAGVSDTVLDAVSAALHLDEAEHAHLFHLARTANESGRLPSRRRTPAPAISASAQRLLHGLTGFPAFIRNARLDVLAINDLGRALYSPAYTGRSVSTSGLGDQQLNMARFCFLDPAAATFYPDWPHTADITVALLRTAVGRDPRDTQLSDLIGQLSTRSPDFAARWGAHDVRIHRTGTKHFHHPVVGPLELEFDAMTFAGDTGLTLTAYSAKPDSASADGLHMLASWAATNRTAPPPHGAARVDTKDPDGDTKRSQNATT